MGERLLRHRKRFKKWNITSWYSDSLIEEMMASNQSVCDDVKESGPRPPKGWPLHRPAEERAILNGVDEELSKDPTNPKWLAAKAVFTLWMHGLRPLYGEWDSRDEYAPIDDAVDQAEQLRSCRPRGGVTLKTRIE